MKTTLVREWMTTDITKANPHVRLHDALRMMNRANIRALPVVEKDNLVGIVTKRDLMRADVSSVMRDIWDQYRQVGDLPLEKIMSKSVITIKEETSMAKAAQVLLENKITALPVVNDEHNMTGILTSTDIFHMLEEEYHTLKTEVLVSDYMSRDLVLIAPETTLLDAQRMMATRRIRALPVVQGDLLVGIITRTDLLSATPAHAAGEDRYEIAKQVLTTPVRFVMTSSPITVDETDLITKAAHLMDEHKIHSLPVLDKQSILRGMITETDIFRLIINKFLPY
jgi:acetoin utilization protein AcuB